MSLKRSPIVSERTATGFWPNHQTWLDVRRRARRKKRRDGTFRKPWRPASTPSVNLPTDPGTGRQRITWKFIAPLTRHEQ
jgi:hypothetical protein